MAEPITDTQAVALLESMLRIPSVSRGEAELARFLAARSKQSVETLEAEFDTLKERGRDVEVLLEKPIEEVRTPAAAPRADRAAAE